MPLRPRQNGRCSTERTKRTPMNLLASAFALVLASAGIASAQLVRLPNTTLTLPADLPTTTGYTTQNALGTLTFSLPMATAFPAGETNRLFVVERNGTLQVVTNLS